MSVTEKETAFLKMVAQALGREKPLTQAPKRDEVGPPVFWREQKFEAHEPLEFFKKNLEALTGRVEIVKSPEEATRQIFQWLQELNAKSVIMWDHADLRRYVKLEGNGIQVHYWSTELTGKELINTAEKADAGITWADYAIGYSGTLALLHGPGRGRSVSLLPPTHIAVCKRSNLVPTMSTVMQHLKNHIGTDNLPSFVDFITGPSRTSDIEMDLSIGVHGPYRVWTIIIDDE